MKTPRFSIYDTYRIGNKEFLILYIGPGNVFPNINCYHVYDLDKKKVRMFAVNAIDQLVK